MATTSESYVLFELAGTTYAIRSATVLHIEMLEHITLVPNSHRAVEGVVFSRGQVIPALNLRVRFGFPREASGMRTRILFTRSGDRVVGLIVDSAREFRNIPAESIRPIEESLAGIHGNYLTGLATIQGRLVLVLELAAVLNLDQDQSLAGSIDELVTRATAQLAETPANK